MSKPSAIAVIDIGKTNAKLVVWDHQGGHILFETDRPNHSIDGPPYRHLDTDGLWEFYLSALHTASQDIIIGKIIVTTHGATVAVLNDEGLALPIPDYENTYPDTINHAYDTIRDAFEQSQSPRLPAGLNFGRQIFALEENFADEMLKTNDFLPFPQYWAWKLCGVKANEVTSLGCHSDLWRPHQKDWSHLAKSRGWDLKFPPMRKAGDVLGHIRTDIARKTGLPEDCQIYCGIHDSNASLLPLINRLDQPFTLISSGTWTICFAIGSKTTPELNEERDTLCNVDLNGNAVPSARFMGGREYGVLANGNRETPTTAAITRLIDNDCFAIPSFADAGGPFAQHPGYIKNRHALKTSEDEAALATLYCALMTDYCLDMIKGAGTIVIEGPFAENPTLCGLLAQLRHDQTVFATPDSAGTSFGAAILAMNDHAIPQRTFTTVLPSTCRALESYKREWCKMLPAAVISDSKPDSV